VQVATPVELIVTAELHPVIELVPSWKVTVPVKGTKDDGTGVTFGVTVAVSVSD
jgi:hypothetical protein